MDYTSSDAYVTDAGTGNRRHQDTSPITTEWSADDANMVIWSLMEILNQGGVAGVAFDPAVPASYAKLKDALAAIYPKRIDLADDVDIDNGDGLFAVRSTLAGTQSTNQHEVNERVRHIFDWMTPAQKAAARSNLAVTDLTGPLQAAIDSGENIDFGSYAMRVSKLTFDQNGKTYRFNGAQLVAGENLPETQMGIIDWKAGYCVVYGMSLVGNWKSNYSSAIYWHSASAAAPAKSNHFYDLVINNILIGILFGEISPAVPVDAPQSENYIYGIRTRGVERVVYENQPNGFLKFIGGELQSSRSEWETVNPGVYSFERACVYEGRQGVVCFVNSDNVKADTSLGYGYRNLGGILQIASGTHEVACQVFDLGGGRTYVSDLPGGYFGNASTSWAALSGDSGVFQLSNVTINKAAGTSAANTALIDLAGHTGWAISLDNVRGENVMHWIFNNGNGQPERWVGNNVRFNGCTAPNVGGAANSNQYLTVTTSQDNLLDLRGTDVNGNDIATWYKRDISGVGSIALDADVPAGTNYPASIQITPAVATGSSEVISMDLTSLATVKATAIKCRPGDTFRLTGWARMTTAGTAQVTITFANAAGAASASTFVANQADILTSSWAYIEGWFVVPASAAYFGIGIRGSAGTVCRMVGLKLSKVG